MDAALFAEVMRRVNELDLQPSRGGHVLRIGPDLVTKRFGEAPGIVEDTDVGRCNRFIMACG
jgi:hypothetical protein